MFLTHVSHERHVVTLPVGSVWFCLWLPFGSVVVPFRVPLVRGMLVAPLLVVSFFFVGSSNLSYGSVLLLCYRQSILWRSKLRADPVLVFLLNGQSVLYDAVAMHFVLFFFPVVRPERLGIMTGMDQEAWFAGFVAFPSRGAPLVVSGPRCPSSWPAWTTGQCRSSQVLFLDKVFLHAHCCATCVLVQTVLHSLAFPQ